MVSEDSRMMELVDADKGLDSVEAYYTHEEARIDRDAWDRFYMEDEAAATVLFDSSYMTNLCTQY
jgi:hypothetical protein